ncbi:hypothetical protein HNV10_16045 [Winogradskyella litoriviva]|uniref:DUF5640 domain-containing protein n=1 Tax=Winogradskyella litoriviva TaxID=1220182 RepID=A0ABX2E8Y4_9FLAO|nr:hypothetical protein [Winogradskyella litoriviva]NRD24766.1 hypothetical protein [Winogradskyella litoriviva]
MKYLFPLFIFSLFIFNTSNPKEDIIGKWKSDRINEIEFFTFDAEGYASFESQGQILGGKEFSLHGEKGKMTYSINIETTPIEIDYTITKLQSGESKKILGILEFLDTNSIKIDLKFDEERPLNFSE